MTDPWVWRQPTDQADLLARLADARDWDVPERERENLCACAHTEITRLLGQADTWETQRASYLEDLRAGDRALDEAKAEIERVWGLYEASEAGVSTLIATHRTSGEWPRCEDCGAELQEAHPDLPRECPQCRLSAKLHLADMKNATLTAERGQARALLARVLDSHRQPWVYGMSVTITDPPGVYAAWRAEIEAAIDASHAIQRGRIASALAGGTIWNGTISGASDTGRDK